uniref:Uncharacterized protein n=1 Tax=Candidozyma auris TaxID=498019 RepID=A0A0L0NWC5_CANAR
MGLRETWRNLLGGPGIKKKIKVHEQSLGHHEENKRGGGAAS